MKQSVFLVATVAMTLTASLTALARHPDRSQYKTVQEQVQKVATSSQELIDISKSRAKAAEDHAAIADMEKLNHKARHFVAMLQHVMMSDKKHRKTTRYYEDLRHAWNKLQHSYGISRLRRSGSVRNQYRQVRADVEKVFPYYDDGLKAP